MTELKVGFDYHLAEVHRSVRYPEGGVRTYFSVCQACGWQGPFRVTAKAASEDAYEHDNTENPADSPAIPLVPGKE